MIRLTQNSFFGGQLDFEMMGRQDYNRYSKGATRLCNFNIMKRGGLDKRHGFDRIFDLTTLSGVTKDTKFRAIPFAYKKTQGFVLLMSGPKCIVVGSSPVTQFKTYDVTDLDGVYASSEINEIDYQQCGDVLFIAHQNHQPARIVHDIDDNGEHGFHYEVLPLNQAALGIPEITGSHITRLAVSDTDHAASLKTEHYKVSAVFDGKETYPCDDYSQENTSPWGATSYNGTCYPMPWTASQKIRLTLQPKSRTVDGVVEYPEELRVYKKAYGYFGLIGTIKIVADDIKLAATCTEPETSYKNSDRAETDSLCDASDGLSDYAKDRTGWLFAEGDYTLGLGTAHKSGYIQLMLGAVYYDVSSDSVTFTYTGWTATGLTLAAGSASSSYALPTSIGSRTQTVDRDDGESDASFLVRWKDAFNSFCTNVGDLASIKIAVESDTEFTEGTLTVTGGDVVINNIKSYRYWNLEAVTFDDSYITPDSSITPPEYDEDNQLFGGTGNYPASVSLSQQRLIWASTKNDPARIWFSEIGDFYTYYSHEIQTASDAMDFILPVTRFAKINHICEMRKLLLFNSACEWLVDSSSSVSGLTYETVQAYPQSYSGSSERLKPIICNNSLVFCERTGQAVRRFAYDISNDGFAGRDVSILSSSIFENNSIVDWTYQQFPYSTLWCVLANGDMASFEFMEEQDIMAWMTHRLGGNGKVVCVATSYSVAPAMDEVTNPEEYEYATHEEVWAVVKRGNALWLERMRVRPRPPEDDGGASENSIYHSLCLDGVRVLNSTNGYQPFDEDGLVWIPADTTTGATITKAEAVAKIAAGVEVYEGFPFAAEYVSVYPNINNGQLGNGQFDIKNVRGCGVRLMNSYGGVITPVGSQFGEAIQYCYNDPENDHRPVFGGGTLKLACHDTNIMSLSGVNNRDGRVKISQADPWPFSILSYEIDFEPETGGGFGR